MKYTAILFSLSLLALSACTKFTPVERTYANYGNMAVGRYWIYEEFNIDSAGAATGTGNFDSCYIEKDTTIGSNTYFKMVRPGFHNMYLLTSFLRDSLHYIVNEKGEVRFSSLNFTDVFREYVLNTPDTVATVSEMMTDKDQVVSVPFGIYATRNFLQLYHMGANYRDFGEYRYLSTRYAENVGIVSETQPFYVSNPGYIEFRLVRWGNAR